MPEILRTACTRDCPDACGLEATVVDGRVVALGGEKDHPVTRGFLCERTKGYLTRQYSGERLTSPLVRMGERLEPATWEIALDHVAEGLRRIRDESGPEAVLHYRMGGSLGMLKVLNDYFFECFGGARVKKGDVCSGAGEAAQLADMGASDSHDPEDLLNSKLILVWGRNLMTSFVHTVPLVTEARRRGAKVVVVNPAPGRTAKLADRVIRPRPGCDRFLALGTARVLFEDDLLDVSLAQWSVGLDGFRELAHSKTTKDWARAAGVSLDELLELAADLGRLRPANIQVGWGLQRRLHGAATIRSLDALAALAGNLGVPGGGVSFYYQRRSAFATSRYKAPPERRGIPEPLLGRGILEASDPPVRGVVVDNGNPVTMLPDSRTVARALRSRELVVVLEQFLTDTAQCADVVLPVTTMLEEEDLVGAYGHHYLTASQPVAERPADVRTDLEIYQELARRLGFGEALEGTPRQWAERLLEPVAGELELEALQQGAVRNPRAPHIPFEGRRFATPDGRFHFVTELDLDEPASDAAYPLSLGCFATSGSQSSQWIDPARRGPDAVFCHPDAAPRLEDGQRVRIVSRQDSVELVLRLDSALRPGLLLLPKGGWLEDGRAANSLIAARATDMGLGAAYYDEPVRLEPA